jgi:tetratricopeptide (TPR) repeat protein
MSAIDAVVAPKLKSLVTYLARIRDAMFCRTAYFKNPDLKNPREFVDASSFIYGIFSAVTIIITVIYFWFPERRLEFYDVIPLDFLIIVGLATFILLSIFRVYDLSFGEFFVCFAYVMGTCAALWATGRLAREGISLYQNEVVAACKDRDASGLCTTPTASGENSAVLTQVQHYLTVGEFWVPFYFSGVLAFVLAARAPSRKLTIAIAVLVSLTLFFFFYRGGGAEQIAQAWLRYNQCMSDPKFASLSVQECETMAKSRWDAVRFHAHLNRALALAETGRQAESAEQFRVAVALDPKFTFNPQLLGRLTELGVKFAFDGHAQEARVYLDELVRRNLSDAAIRVERGRALAVSGNYADAIEDFTAAIKIKPNDGAAFALRGVSHAANKSAGRGDNDGLADLEEAVRLEPKNDNFLRLRGSAKSLLGNTTGAIEDVKAAIELDPANAQHYYTMGEIYRGTNQANEAIEYYRKAISLNADYLSAHQQLAAIYAYLRGANNDPKMHAEAETHYLAAIKLKDNDEGLLLDYGNLYAREEGGCPRAVEIYDRALKINASSADAFNSKGDCASAGWDYQTAIEYYSEALRLSEPQRADQRESPYYSRRPTYYKNRAAAYRERQQYDLAVADLSQAIELEARAGGENANTYNARAIVYLLKRDYDRAEADFGKAIALRPDFSEALSNRATLYEQKGDYEKSVDDLTAVIKLDPEAAAPLAERCALRALLARRSGSAGPMDEILADCAKAVTIADASAKDDPGLSTKVHFYYGMALWNAGKSAEADRAHQTALEMSKVEAEALRALEQRILQKAGPTTAKALGSVSWYALFARRPQDALAAAEEAVKLDPSLLWPKTNRAHAHMILGYANADRAEGQAEIKGARLIYLERKGETIADGLWETIIVEDFRQFRDHGLQDLSLMSEVESAFAAQ